MDTLTREQRHETMSHIRSKNTSPEKEIRSALHRAGFRYRICDRRYPGTPDIVLPSRYAVIFINGCFWHAHEGCRYYRFPKSNMVFWRKKFMRNKERDAAAVREYQDKCWRVCIVWECAIRGKGVARKIEDVTQQIILWLDETNDPYLEISGK